MSVRDLLDGLAGVLGEDLVEALAHVDDLAGVDLDVGRLAFEAADETWWMRILAFGSANALAVGAAGQEQRAHAHARCRRRWSTRRA